MSSGDDESSSGFVIDTRSNNDTLGVNIYQRVGMEFIFSNGFTLGASVRSVNATLDFGPNGQIDISEPHYSLILGSHF